MTLVVKIGGGAGVATENIVREIAQLVANGERVVLVHGGSDLTNTLSEQLNHPMKMITSPSGMTSRYTDAETLRIFSMAVAGQINTDLVAQLQRQGVNAFGMAGVDGRLLVARRKAVVRSVTPEGRVQILRDDYTGQIEQVNSTLLETLLDAGYTPVIAPLALSHEGERLNVDGDRAAAAIASALHAESLVIMTNVVGLLADPQDASTLIPRIPAAELESYMQYAKGRMRKKLLGAQEALQGGVTRVCIGSQSLQEVLNGAGTAIGQNTPSTAPISAPAELQAVPFREMVSL
ncbi:[LysW]-aminoadipate kinase [Tengunoibacter tsumagoiensis]|uniref:Putative [LysW]-aminoadipate kinase n=1 Tax=Tengunoibacter tsumagoiensis TaxID=2014871 RepID=A0A402A3I7_9CHLR|nr:[LysW]-aminoadipate kinase [Tengunoibacter tsumagoiensis]GCE13713.1 acetylglutamate kinase [Tengunoibacter tsumagoiensis]